MSDGSMTESDMERSLLAQLASKFASQSEVIATDALTFILRHSTGARGSLQSLLGNLGCGSPVAYVTTQSVIGDESRPDLSVFDKSDQLMAFIEAKFWAGLMVTQPVDYLQRLVERRGQVLLFVVPEARIDSVWAELEKRATNAGMPFSDVVAAVSARSASTAGGAKMALTSWTRLLSILKAGSEQAHEREAVANLEQLEGLVRRFESDEFGPLSSADLSDLTVPRRVKALSGLVQAVIVKAESKGVIATGGTRPAHTWTSAGRYLGLRHGNSWLGIDHDAWALYQASPLWLWFGVSPWSRGREVRRALSGWEAKSPQRLFVNDDDSVSVPLFIRSGAERDEVIDDLLCQIEEVDAALAAAGLTRATGAPEPVSRPT
jgi:hypothetical protein